MTPCLRFKVSFAGTNFHFGLLLATIGGFFSKSRTVAWGVVITGAGSHLTIYRVSGGVRISCFSYLEGPFRRFYATPFVDSYGSA
jgi:hypothetical protein